LRNWNKHVFSKFNFFHLNSMCKNQGFKKNYVKSLER
jgi:hypothetical protein